MAEETKQVFELRKVYIKDMSFESPMAPDIFKNPDATPTIDVQLNIGHDDLGDNMFESILVVTVNGKLHEKDAFLAEVHQAGVYEISGISRNEALGAALEVTCPNMLFPFAREAINELIVRGGFPQLLLSPVNFQSLYLQRARNEAADSQSDQTTAADDGPAAAEAKADRTSS